jgi:predicted metalloprotease
MPSDVSAADYEEYSAWLDEIIGSVEQYWQEWWEKSGEGSWQAAEIRDIPPGDSGTTCNGLDVGVRGTFYCPEEDYIGLQEAAQLLPFYFELGPYAVATVIAHEYGHVVQDNLGIVEPGDKAQERQADCLAGAWFNHFQESGGFDDPSAAFLQAYDAIRVAEAGDEIVEFYDALRQGYLGGPKHCLELFG